MEMKFYICAHCGNIIAYVTNRGVPVFCCGEKMSELTPNTTDGAKEKHVPLVEISGNKVTVTVGEVTHPMLAEHSIKWIGLQTAEGNQRKELQPGDAPQAVFLISDTDKVIAAYEYCDLHGLWKKEI